MKKEDIYLDLSKLTEQEIKSVYNTLIDNNESIYEETIDNLNNGVFDRHYNALICEDNEWVESVDNILRKEITLQQFKDLFTFKGITSQDVRNAEEDLFKDLTIGQEIEMNGYVLKVERTTKKWYLFKNKDTDSIAYEYFDSNDLKHYKTEENIKLTEITDKDFINQLEKFSK